MSGCDRSWLELAALVVRHSRYPFAVLSADVISELGSAEQTDKNGGEVSGHEFHGSIPQPDENLATVEQLFSGDMLRHQDKAAAVLSHDSINGPVWCVAFCIASVKE